jgi:hypothetical protein
MDAKEKAKDLFTTYRFALSIPNAPLGEYKDQIAKQCALIAVDEIEDAIDFDWMQVQNLESQHRYWQKVKEEIEKF